MTLKKSISGIRGTIGGEIGTNLTPIDIVECTAGFGTFLKNSFDNVTVVVGKDGRISGDLVSTLAIQTLISLGINVIDLGYTTTPTLEMAVPNLNAQGGIIFTASHNPKEWNALKFINHLGEFISAEGGKEVIKIIESGSLVFSPVDELGTLVLNNEALAHHIEKILQLRFINQEKIKNKKYKIVVDCINSTGAIAIPALLDKLNCEYILINEKITGEFAHNPEPLPAHLMELFEKVKEHNADIGIVVDPDVDRLAFVDENGVFFGEEYTLVACADHVLTHSVGNTVSNLSSTRALRDITIKLGGTYTASAVGEVNVVNQMKATNAIIGGEGNGGIILPELHYGRDALVGIALTLSLLAERNTSLSALKKSYASYTISKNKIQLSKDLDVTKIISYLQEKYASEQLNTIDGLKIDFADGWVHLRESNTEPIIRVYSEAKNEQTANLLASKIIEDVKSIKG